MDEHKHSHLAFSTIDEMKQSKIKVIDTLALKINGKKTIPWREINLLLRLL
jgi:hypothetical protein